MLGKIIKYDFKAMAKNLLPIYASFILMTFIFSFIVKMKFKESLIVILIYVLFIASISASIISTIYFACARFDKGLLKNEGYLSFALPVSTATHIMAKTINALIWGVISMMVLTVAGTIMGMIIGSIKDVVYAYRTIIELFGIVEKDVISAIIQTLIITGLGIIASICMVYCGIAVSHLFDKYRRLVLVGFIVASNTIRTYIATFLFSDDFFFSSNSLLFIRIELYLMSIVAIIVYSIITWYILDKKLNLE